MSFRIFFACIVSAVLAGCGGGGSSSAANPGAGAPITISVAPQTMEVSATTTGAAPVATMQLMFSRIPAGGLTVGGSYSTHGIASITLSDGGNVENINFTFQPPASLGAGVYTDTLKLEVCLDEACTQPVSNSPLEVAVTYTVTVGNPATATPSLTAITPSTTVVGSASFTMVADGSEFAPSSVLMWNGQARTTTYVSPTSLSAQITAADLANVGTSYVTVSNGSTGGGVSPAMAFVVSAPTPSVTAVSPSTVGSGGSAFALTVTGSGFDPAAQVYWNGSARPTTYVSSTQLSAQVAAADIGTTGVFPITVINLDGSSVPSNAASVTVVNAPLSLTRLSPTSVTFGGTAFVETVIGTGFNTASTVRWNGIPRATTFVSTTELLAQIDAADIANAGTAQVTVVNTGSTSATSAAQVVTVAPASIDAVAFQINPQHNGSINFANIIAPSAFPINSAWTAVLDGPPSYALIAGGRVFVTVSLTGGSAELVALDAATGAKAWGPVALPYSSNATYENGKVFVLSANIGTAGMMSAYDAATGTRLWSTALTSQYWFTGPPTAANGFVYAAGAGSGGTLYAVDQATGALTWSSMVMNGDNSSPSVTADGVYVTYPCQTYDFRPLTGESVWHDSTGCEGGGGATGLVANGVAYSPNGITGYGGMAFDAETGSLLSSYSASAPPAVGKQMGFFLQAGTLRGITLSGGVIRWSFAGDGTLTTAPILVNDYVFISGTSGNLYALDANTGSQIWTINLGGTMTSGSNGYGLMQASGLSAGGGLLVVPVGNKLTAFRLSTNP